MEFKTELCRCGKVHKAPVNKIIVGSGVIGKLPSILTEYGIKKPFILSDQNTYIAAAANICKLLDQSKIPYSQYSFAEKSIEPDEFFVGAAIMHFDLKCDCIVAVGSGVIGDIAKVLAAFRDTRLITIATAPSMDGYASATSSMTRDGLKESLPSKCPAIIIGDTDILKNAPQELLISGLGDMLAKYISIAEWRISHVINGEYYCEEIATLVRSALKKCIDHAEGLLSRDASAVEAVFQGLVTAGMAMSYAGLSRPASGIEHYFSHIWDMRGVALGAKTSTHGIQCAIATLISAKLYEQIKAMRPNIKKATGYAKSFDVDAWSRELERFLGKEGAASMIALEKKENKYSLEKHRKRISTIVEKWDILLSIIDEEIPAATEIEKILDKIGCPKTVSKVGIDEKLLPMTFKATKDIRDKYVLSRLAWDLGVIDELSF